MALNSSRNGSWKLLLMYLGTTADAVDLLYLYYVLFRATKNSSTLIGLLGSSLPALFIVLDRKNSKALELALDRCRVRNPPLACVSLA